MATSTYKLRQPVMVTDSDGQSYVTTINTVMNRTLKTTDNRHFFATGAEYGKGKSGKLRPLTDAEMRMWEEAGSPEHGAAKAIEAQAAKLDKATAKQAQIKAELAGEKPAKTPAAPKETHPCLCGCGEACPPKSLFRQGHDARMKGYVSRAITAKGTENPDMSIAAQVERVKAAITPEGFAALPTLYKGFYSHLFV